MIIVKDQFKDRLKMLRNQRGITSEELADALDIPHSSIRRMESTNQTPRPERLEQLAKYFGVTIDYLLGRDDIEKEGKHSYGVIPYNPDNMIRLPVLGSIRAGEPLLMMENFEGYEYVESELMRGRTEGFILVVKGNSMIGDRIFEGDRVVCLKQNSAEPHEIAVVAIDGEEATLKRVKCVDDVCVLSSSNPEFEPMIFPANTVKILGIAISVRHDL